MRFPPRCTSVTLDLDALASVLSAYGTSDLFAVVQAQTFAMERAWRWVSALDAVQDAMQHGVKAPSVVGSAYQNVLNLSGPQDVTRQDYSIADQILVAGRI